ncbi:MAG: acyltransferase domain-containing protein [Deltaproteobacteria bacterium]|nr:acyltransferase domain-containing protein [Deltaproteobacteria bacterium]
MAGEPRLGVAVIGLSVRVAGADDERQFWQNLHAGVDSVFPLSDDELRAAGLTEDLIRHPDLVKCASYINGLDLFDADFFKVSARDAELMDPQQRLLLEMAWTALEDAGYVSEREAGKTAVFAGLSECNYPPPSRSDALQAQFLRYSGYGAARIAYKLGLTGPALTLFTACSTGLVVAHAACEALLTNQCDLALACAAGLDSAAQVGWIAVDDALSKDGLCRSFDADASGTRRGDGVAVVVLKRLEDAVADRDPIRAVIRATATNNDGQRKIGFHAPSILGQAEVIESALDLAEVTADEVDYVEAHGTATALGDPIEIAALTRAFSRSSERRQYCAVGSVKSNVGHTDTAAGLVGLIKLILALENEALPPSLHYRRPNPNIDFANSPFFVNDKLRPWPRGQRPRIAGVSSFGIGGTNAHAIVQEAPVAPPAPIVKGLQLLVFSALNRESLAASTATFAEHFDAQPTCDLADVAYTLQVGRRAFPWRQALMADDAKDAASKLRAPGAAPVLASHRPPEVVFMFPGFVPLSEGWGKALYEGEKVFRDVVDRASDFLRPILDFELRQVFCVEAKDGAPPLTANKPRSFAALMTAEYALARTWLAWGIKPSAVFGHSMGEYTAACVAGVLSFEDMLTLSTARGKLADQVPPGRMLAVFASSENVEGLLPSGASIAAINARDRCTVAGGAPAVEAAKNALEGRGIECRLLDIPAASHCALVDGILPAYGRTLAGVTLDRPKMRLLSCVTGSDAADFHLPEYWLQHFRQPVRFSSAVDALEGPESLVVMEVGPGHSLSRIITRHWPQDSRRRVALPIEEASPAGMRKVLGDAWLLGVEPDWPAVHDDQRKRVHLPTYQFQRQRYWTKATPAQTTDRNTPPSPPSPPSPSPTTPPPSASTDAAKELGPTEQYLGSLWRELLGGKAVALESDFFALGGDSMVALRMAKMVRDHFGVNISLRSLLGAPTLAAMAALIDSHRQKG